MLEYVSALRERHMDNKRDNRYLTDCDLTHIFELADCACILGFGDDQNCADHQNEQKWNSVGTVETTLINMLSLSDALVRLRIIAEICHESLSANERKILSDICNTIQCAEREERWRELHYCRAVED